MKIRIYRRGEILGYSADTEICISPTGFSRFRTIECDGDLCRQGIDLRNLIAGIIKNDFYIPHSANQWAQVRLSENGFRTTS
jgi:hypothetical protein